MLFVQGQGLLEGEAIKDDRRLVFESELSEGGFRRGSLDAEQTGSIGGCEEEGTLEFPLQGFGQDFAIDQKGEEQFDIDRDRSATSKHFGRECLYVVFEQPQMCAHLISVLPGQRTVVVATAAAGVRGDEGRLSVEAYKGLEADGFFGSVGEVFEPLEGDLHAPPR